MRKLLIFAPVLVVVSALIAWMSTAGKKQYADAPYRR